MTGRVISSVYERGASNLQVKLWKAFPLHKEYLAFDGGAFKLVFRLACFCKLEMLAANLKNKLFAVSQFTLKIKNDKKTQIRRLKLS